MQQLNESLKELVDREIWINWFWGKDNKGKKTKVPLAKSDTPSTWSKFDDLQNGKLFGIMFPPDKSLLGIDLDNCLSGTEIIHAEKQKVVELLIEADTYTEISPSGKGLHLWFKLTEPFEIQSNSYKLPTGEKYEVYNTHRFFTVTNRSYKELKPIREIDKNEALKLLSLIGYPWGSVKSERVSSKENLPVLEDSIVLEKMFGSKNGAKIRSLYDGYISHYNNDHSSADMALCHHLAFWTGGNPVQMDRLWLKSKLGNRDKSILRNDYRQRTIVKAIQATTEFYSGSDKKNLQSKSDSTSELIFLKSSEIVSKPIDWLWEGKIAKGKVTMIAGDPGLGKSQVSLHLAGVVSTGGLFPGAIRCKKGKVLLFSAEDGAEDTINPRLQATGADGNQIYIFSTVRMKDKEKFFDLSADLPLLKKTLESDKEISLIIIDPITAFLGETDSHKNAEVRGLLSALSKMAEEHGVAIVVVTHLNKSSGTNAMNKITGSLAFVAAARAAYMVVKDKDDESRRLFLTVKNNLAVDKGGFAYKVESVTLGNIGTSKVVWEEGVITMSLAEAMEEHREESETRSEIVDWLENYLKKNPEGVALDKIERDAYKEGISSRRSLDRASKKLFIEKIYQGARKPYIWKLDPLNDVFSAGNST